MPVNTPLLSDGTSQFGSDVSIRGLVIGGEAPLRVSSFQTFAIGASVVSGSSTFETTLNYNVVTPAANDVCVVAAPSAISSHLAYNAYVNSSNSVVLRFSNVTTGNMAQTAQTWGIALLRYST